MSAEREADNPHAGGSASATGRSSPPPTRSRRSTGSPEALPVHESRDDDDHEHTSIKSWKHPLGLLGSGRAFEI